MQLTDVEVLRDANGTLSKNKNGQYIFTKDGIYFSLSFEQMAGMQILLSDVIPEIAQVREYTAENTRQS